MKHIIKIMMINLFFLSSLSIAQNQLRDNLFGDYDKLLDQLQKQDASVLSPENFEKALKYYKKASTDYQDKDESLVDIKENLQESKKYALKALEVVALANDALESVISARDLALRENAPIFAADEWEDAEEVFFDATSNLEDDDMDDARKYGGRAEKLFKQSEIMAIKNGILGDARSQIHLAERADAEKYCFNTYRNAQSLLAETEAVLKADPFDKEAAIKKAMQASYQARHAQYLSETIQKMSVKMENWELLILQFEEILSTVSAQFHYEPKFDKGFDNSIKTLMSYVSNLQAEQKRLFAENTKLEEELSTLQESEATTSAALQKKETLEKKVDKIKNLFTNDEAVVIHQGNNIIIRLIGLQFPSGKAIIQPEYFSLLTKVQRAIREFPDNYLLIEGHTDATGNSYKNKTLSEQRARAITEYLIANLELRPEQIEYYGMGEQKPIASNKTKEGRLRNRRIDIILSLEDS